MTLAAASCAAEQSPDEGDQILSTQLARNLTPDEADQILSTQLARNLTPDEADQILSTQLARNLTPDEADQILSTQLARNLTPDEADQILSTQLARNLTPPPASADCVLADHLVMRIHRNGHVIVEGVNMTMEHRGEVPITICPDGNFWWVGDGIGMSINDYSPYSFDVCSYQIEFLAEGDLKPPDCVLNITVQEEIKSGECTHYDPYKTIEYPYAAWGEMYEVGFFELPNIAGKATYEREKEEMVGIVHWIEEVQVWGMAHLPFCEPEDYQIVQVPTTEPWPTPTWKP